MDSPTLENAHMPYLFLENGVMKLLFTKNTGSWVDTNWKAKFFFFQEPQLSDPKFNDARAKIVQTHKDVPRTIWKTFRLDDMAKGTAQRAEGFDPDPDVIECCPFILDGKTHYTATRKGILTNAARPKWARSVYGWTSSEFAVWGRTANSRDFGVAAGAATPVFYSIDGAAQKSHIYRIVPIADQPAMALMTILHTHQDARTLLVDLKNPLNLKEVLVNGASIYKSSILGTSCAHTVAKDAERTVVISDGFTLVTPSDLLMRLEPQQEVALHPRAGLVTPHTKIITAFFDYAQPCAYPWEIPLRAAFTQEITEAGGARCKGCKLGGIKQKYIRLIADKLKSEPAPQVA